MKRCMAIALLVAAVFGRAALAQPAVVPTTPPSVIFEAAASPDDAPGRFYSQGEYLVWWMRGAALPPLVTVSPPGTPIGQAGVLGSSGTVTVFGQSTVNDDARSGMRFTFGAWVDDEKTFGVEGNFLMLETKAVHFAAASNGSPILGRPFIDATTGRQNAELVAFPGDVTGSVAASAETDGLIGAGFLMRENLTRSGGFSLDVLGGYRYLRFTDRLAVAENLTSVNPASPVFIAPGTRIQVGDAFGAKNEFNGFDAGLSASFDRGPWELDLLAKLAVGPTHQAVDINGGTTITVPTTAPVSSTGGLLALSPNIGHHSRTEISVVPELDVKAGYQITPRLRATVGYSFLYWSDVVRAGDAVSTTVNPTLLPNSPTAATGPQNPAFAFQRSGMWAQGLDFGLEFRY